MELTGLRRCGTYKKSRLLKSISGLSLVEVMISLFLTTFGLLALATTQIPPMQLNEKSENMTKALFLASATLERISKDRGLGANIAAQIASPTINVDISESEPTAYGATTSGIFTRTISHAAVGATTYPRRATVVVNWSGANGNQRQISVASIVR